MAINPLQLPQGPVINSLADWSPLERLVQNWQAQQKEAAQNEQAYRDVGGGQGQPQQGGFLSDLGRKFGLLPEAAPPQAAAPARAPQAGADPMANYSNAIANIESGGRYDLLGPVTKTGDRAIGKYQVMGNNVPEWTAAALGKPMNVADFRASPEAQEAVFKHRFGMYVQKYGPENAAKAWFAGEGGMENPNARDQLGTSVASYGEKFRRNAGLPAGATPPVVAQGGNPNTAPAPSAWAARSPLSAALADPNASPLDNAPWPQGNVGAPQAVAQGGEPGAVPPLQERAVPAAPVVASDAPEARAVQNLTSDQPAAAAGLDRETLARMYRNPVTRPLAAAVLQKQMDPGSWSFQQVGDRLIGTHNKSGQVKVVAEDIKPFVFGNRAMVRDASSPTGYRDITPPEPPKAFTTGEGQTHYVPKPGGGYEKFGDEGPGKIQREIDQRRQAATASGGHTPEEIESYALTGKFPKEDLSATEIKVTKDADDAVLAAHGAIKALDRSIDLSKKSFQGYGASTLGAVTANAPSWFPGHEAGVATRALENQQLRAAVSQLKDAFGRNPSNREDAIMERLQGSVNETQEVRKEIFDEARKVFADRLAENQRTAELMHSGKYFKKGGATPPSGSSMPAPEATPKASTTKPSLSDFMIKARAANPGVSEGELARFWKQKYGG